MDLGNIKGLGSVFGDHTCKQFRIQRGWSWEYELGCWLLAFELTLLFKTSLKTSFHTAVISDCRFKTGKQILFVSFLKCIYWKKKSHWKPSRKAQWWATSKRGYLFPKKWNAMSSLFSFSKLGECTRQRKGEIASNYNIWICFKIAPLPSVAV